MDGVESLPAWLLVAVLFLVFLGVAAGSRWLVRHVSSKERGEELAKLANTLISGVAAAFAFFIGVAITVTWGGVSAGQTAVESLAASSQQLAWATNNLSDRTEATALLTDLQVYLDTVVAQDPPYLAVGDTTSLPSAVPLDTLQDAVHAYAYAENTPSSESTALVSSAQALGSAQSTVSAIAQRSMPTLLAVLLVLVSILLATILGVATMAITRPSLVAVWCLVIAMSVTLVLVLDRPYGGGIAVNMSSITQVASQLLS